jgi:replicative DNA helicase
MARNGDSPFDKALPSNIEAERSILGAILLDNQTVNQAAERLKRDDFFLDSHRRVYDKMLLLMETGRAIDPITLQEELQRAGDLSVVGGAAFIAALIDGVPRFSNIEEYARIVKGKSILRRLITTSNQVMNRCFDAEEEPEALLDEAERAILAIAEDRIRQGFVPISEVAHKQFAHIEEISGHEQLVTGIATGYRDLDYMTSGLQRGDMVIVAARPSMGKCITADSTILLTNGSLVAIEEIYRRRSASLLTLHDDFTFATAEPSGFLDDGLKPVFRVTTRLGRAVETTITHPFLTINGWRPLAELRPGDKVAVPRKLAVFGRDEMRECEAKLLGYLIGDGCLTKLSPELSACSEALREDFTQAVAEFGGVKVTPLMRVGRGVGLRVRQINLCPGKRNPLRVWLESLGLYGCNSHTKFVPAPVFTLRRELVATFLNRLFATDGWAALLKSGQPQLGYATVSERLARQVQHLLLRFGVIAALKKRSVKYKGGRRGAWQLDITDAKSIQVFVAEIGIFGKEERLAAVLEVLEKRKYQTNRDLIPVGVWQHIAQSKGAESWASLARRAGLIGHTNIHVGQRALSRQRLTQLAHTLDDARLGALAASEVYWDEIVSVEPLGEKQVYDLTVPRTHNFVANDICVHNTAFCLNVAQNAAMHTQRHGERAVVGVFSLEMSKEQLVQRMLCSQARIDAHKLRTGMLSKEDWRHLALAVGELAETRIFLDDTPAISVLELRAKARRLKNEQRGLDMLIIDYLQLMSGRGRVESRQQEVSQISRELKAVAKELNVPVVALSQLSRAVESRSDHRPQLSDLRESGCLAGESLVTLADTGAQVPIKDLAGRSGFAVWALNEATMRLERATVSRAFATGVKPVFRLTTRLGRSIRATANHKFRTFDGWRRLDELRVGERLALPRQIASPERQTMSDAELALLGHLIGDGCTLPRHAIQYTTRERDLAETVAALAAEVFGGEVEPRLKRERTWYQVYLSSTRHHTHGVRSAVAEWLGGLGVWGLRSYEKRVPGKVFEQPRAAIAKFLRHLWATDGCVWVDEKQGKHHPGVYYATSSEALARDVQSLLLRIEINARLRRIPQTGKGRDQWHVVVSGRADVERFADAISAVGQRRMAAVEKLRSFIQKTTANANRDSIPAAVWPTLIMPSMQRHDISTREMMVGILTAYCGTGLHRQDISRSRAGRIAGVVHSQELRRLAESDVYWDQIVAIEPDGEAEVFDLTVEGRHNFIANNCFVHNSIEQDADLVMFIYRDDVYNPETEKQNIAEIIIGKQRNGPIGTVELVFLKQLTRFEDKYRE